jgi:membrane protein
LWSLSTVSGLSLYGLGLAVETLIFAALYMIMPYGRTRISHALIGGLTAALLWEATRHVLIWYFATLSSASILYGSLTTSVVVLLSMEVAATLLLLGAQVIAEYERIGLE